MNFVTKFGVVGVLLFFGIGASAQCKIHFKDSESDFESVLVAKLVQKSGIKEKYAVTLNPGSQFESTETVAFDGDNSPMTASDSVPHPTKVQLLKEYNQRVQTLLSKHEDRQGGGTTYSIDKNSQCDSIEATLIEFFVNEFFFYG